MPSAISEIQQNIFSGVATDELPKKRRGEVRAQYLKARFSNIFPTGSSKEPVLLVGREGQMQQLAALADETLEVAPGKSAASIIGVVLHGPRGTGKTVLLNAFSVGMQGRGAGVLKMTGNNALGSEGKLIKTLVEQLPALPETTETLRGEGEVKASVMLVGADGRMGAEASTRSLGGKQRFGTVESALRAVLSQEDAAAGLPLVIAIDEAHASDPAALGQLLNAAQSLSGPDVGLAVAVVMAGTPDVIDVLRNEACRATWFMDRAGRNKRLAPVPNDLPPQACARAIALTLDAAGVAVKDAKHLAAMAAECKGSPYFLQVLGESALVDASKSGNVADFSSGGGIDLAFRDVVLARYEEAWGDLNEKGLSGCARQLGALWRARGGGRGRITDGLVKAAIASGVEHAPKGIGSDSPWTAKKAEAHFRHLGLLWSPTGSPTGPWGMGLPSIFGYVDQVFSSSDFPQHYAARPALEADMARIIGLAANPKADAAEESRDRDSSSRQPT
ncbi:MAG: ATP-binding protein [Gammaproteobacteria bacterium]|nr:ATP-binding protein [Gammaproteobacteria bacterium]